MPDGVIQNFVRDGERESTSHLEMSEFQRVFNSKEIIPDSKRSQKKYYKAPMTFPSKMESTPAQENNTTSPGIGKRRPDTIASLTQSIQPVQNILADVDLKTNPASQPKLITEMNEEITAELRGDGLVVKSHNIHIETKDLDRLTGETWLNDKIIDGYLKMISDRKKYKAPPQNHL